MASVSGEVTIIRPASRQRGAGDVADAVLNLRVAGAWHGVRRVGRYCPF
jgi:hypothetical protein